MLCNNVIAIITATLFLFPYKLTNKVLLSKYFIAKQLEVSLLIIIN